MRIFRKTVKNRLSVGSVPESSSVFGGWGLRPQIPALLLPRTITTFVGVHF